MVKIYKQITLIGVGLIGSSLARAIKANDLCDSLIGYDENTEHQQKIRDLALFDQVADDLKASVQNSDLVVICTPLNAFVEIAKNILPCMKKGSVLSDVGSCKLSVVEQLTPILPKDIYFIPAHPIAGTEHSGPESGFAELFDQRYCILTPAVGMDHAPIDQLRAFWEGMGAFIEIMDPLHHDRVLAITSHLPHVIAYTIVKTAADLERHLRVEQSDKTDDLHIVHKNEVMRYAAGGFRDFTRIADSNPIMWRDILLQNKEPILEMLGRFSEDLLSLQRAIRWGDGETLENWFRDTKEIRKGVVEMNQAGQFIAQEGEQEDDHGN